MKIGIINGDEPLKININDKNVALTLLHSDTANNFDILVFNKPIKFVPEKLLQNRVGKIYALVNIDEYKSFSMFANTFLITYGMNNKACVTASSIESDKIQICIQRNLLAFNGEIVEEQEFRVDVKNADTLLYQVMFLAAANVLYYAGPNKLQKWF